MKLAVAAVAAAAALLALAPTATADPEGDFLGRVEQIPGASVTPFTQGFLLTAGRNACTDLQAGGSVDEVAARTFFPGGSPGQIRMLVQAAHDTMCPEGQ